MRTRAKMGKLALIVAMVMIFSALLVPAGNSQTVHHELMTEVRGMNVEYHLLSEKEMKSLEKSVGVRDPNKNYNEIIDGHGTGLAPPSAKDWKHMVNHLRVVDSISGVRANRASYDLSKTKYFPPIGNQGQQGSCASWAVNYYAHTIIEAEDYGWDASSGNKSYLMSPAWVYNMIDGGVDQGSTFGENALVLQHWGSASLATMPYYDTNHQGMGGPRAMREAAQYKIKDYYFINNTGKGMIYTIKHLIDEGIPVTFGIDADIYKDAFSDGNYIISSKEYSASLTPNHGQTIVGYDDFITDDGDVGAFKIANSWGGGWGDHGFYWVTYKAFYTEVDYNNTGQPMYMIDVPHYQPKLMAEWEFNGTVEMNVNISVGVQTSSGMNWTNAYFVKEMPTVHVPLPQVMIFDITPLYKYYQEGYTNFTLNISSKSAQKGTLYQFYVESYSTYIPGMPQVISRNAPGLPISLPGKATVNFTGYTPIPYSTALDTNLLTFVNYSGAQGGWVAVPYDHYQGASAMKSVLVAPDAYGPGKAVLAAKITSGPGQMTFYWKLSAGSGASLSLYEGDRLLASTHSSGNWTKVSVLIGKDTRYLYWVFERNTTSVGGQDTAWLDAISWEHRSDKVPTPPSNLTAKVGTGYVSLKWNPGSATSAAPLLDYGIFRSNSTSGELKLVKRVDASLTEFNDTQVKNGVTYHYVVKAENYVGFSDGTNMIAALPVEKPKIPLNVTANSTFGGVNISWIAPTNVNAAGLSNYTIYRALNGTGNFVRVGAINATQLWYNDTSAAKGVKYDYYVVAVNWMAQSGKSKVVSGMAFGSPYAPQNVKTEDGTGFVIIKWSKPTNNGGAPITGYVIYRKAPGKDFVKVGEVDQNTFQYKDTSVQNNIKYTYVVVAKNKFGEGNRSTEVSANPADIILNLSGSPIHMTYATFGGIIAVIVLLIVVLVVLLKKRKKKKAENAAKEEKTEEQKEPDKAPEEEQSNGEDEAASEEIEENEE